MGQRYRRKLQSTPSTTNSPARFITSPLTHWRLYLNSVRTDPTEPKKQTRSLIPSNAALKIKQGPPLADDPCHVVSVSGQRVPRSVGAPASQALLTLGLGIHLARGPVGPLFFHCSPPATTHQRHLFPFSPDGVCTTSHGCPLGRRGVYRNPCRLPGSEPSQSDPVLDPSKTNTSPALHVFLIVV